MSLRKRIRFCRHGHAKIVEPDPLEPGKLKLGQKLGVAQTVFLANRVFVPCQKGPFWRKRRKWPICIRPTENKGFAPQMAGVTQAKAWFRKSRVCSSLKNRIEKPTLTCWPFPYYFVRISGFLLILHRSRCFQQIFKRAQKQCDRWEKTRERKSFPN